MDLEKIQAQLKSHIRQHQILVEEMKLDPHNVEIRQKVQSLQAELTTLSEKQRHVVQQLKQNIQPRSEVFSKSKEQELSPTYNHQMQSSNHDTRIIRDRSPHSIMNNTKNPRFSSHRAPGTGTGRHSGHHHTNCISPPPTAKFFPNITQNNIVHLKEDRESPVTRKPDMVTTGMQTVPTPKNDSMRLKTILPKPEARKLKVSLGIQTSKPEQRTGKQNAEICAFVASETIDIRMGNGLATLYKCLYTIFASVILNEPETNIAQLAMKLNFLSTLGLITVSKCREINSQKNERRRRTSAIFSPYSSFQFFDEPKRSSTGIKRGRGRPTKNGDSGLKSPLSPSPVFVPINGFKTPSDENRSDNQMSRNLSTTSPKAEEHEDHCAVCQQSGEVLMCDTCILVFHLKCLSPPLTRIPTGMWMCPKCQESIKNKEPMEWPGTLAVAHSYLKHRAEKDKEKQKLLSRNQELKLQELDLQRKVNELSSAIVTQIQKKTEIVESTKQAQEKLQKLKRFIQTVHSS